MIFCALACISGCLIGNDCYGDQETEIEFQGYESSILNYEAEPAIQGLVLAKDLTLKNSPIYLYNYMSPNPQITTLAGIDRFNLTADGIVIKKDGLYRVSLFQGFYTQEEKGECSMTVSFTPGDARSMRYQFIQIEPYTAGEIRFSQIFRINAGQKLQIVLKPFSGTFFLMKDFQFSGLTIEEIR